jgi:hypothetical protein
MFLYRCTSQLVTAVDLPAIWCPQFSLVQETRTADRDIRSPRCSSKMILFCLYKQDAGWVANRTTEKVQLGGRMLSVRGPQL